MAEHEAIGAALAEDGNGEIEAAELEAELEALLRTEDDPAEAAASPPLPSSTAASSAPAAKPTASAPSPSMTGAVPGKPAAPAPA